MFKELSIKEKKKFNRMYKEMLRSYEFGLLATLYNCQKEGFKPYRDKIKNERS